MTTVGFIYNYNERRTTAFKAIGDSRLASVNKRKTAMCRNRDKCPFGDKCNFAHSKEELRVAICAFGDTCTGFRKGTCKFDHSKSFVPPVHVPEPEPVKKAAFVINIDDDSDSDSDDDENLTEEDKKMIAVCSATAKMVGLK